MSSERGLGGAALSHSKEQLSLAYIQSLIAMTGLNGLEPRIDNYGIDITLTGKDFNGEFDEPHLAAQLKCAQLSAVKIDKKTKEIVYKLPSKNYNKLVKRGLFPKILVVHLAPNNQSDWIYFNKLGLTMRHASYWLCLTDKPMTTNQNITVRVPLSQQLTPRSLIWMMTKISNGEDLTNCGGNYDE
ncbi:DUF4365 domain-containing protein [Vibrio parahaemolyticus]|uniref:DUF4365 domain-containing protein n=1 Tax=Vibrio parahaemolyticus TaxID=670 RepID=UPI001121CCFA|nr:DUF4365 domain-containing protein [Vibrio parahaemolyticus]TOG85990.1 hypothetical protein CGI92_25255 [Vibrio parahaemolyticus]